MKRLSDLLFSVLALTIFSIPIITISLLLKFKEKHPIIFYQERIGLYKKKFYIYKFQTMVDDSPTRIGRLLRNSGLDELLQFLNVIKGTMSIVGPRALTEFDINRLGWNTDSYSKRWSVKPGITGLAQIYGGQHKKISWFWDSKYLENNNVFIDFILIIVSFAMNMFGKKRIRNLIWPKKELI